MDPQYLLTEFDGRIGRKQFWIGMVCLVVMAFALVFVLGLTLGILFPPGVVGIVGNLIMLYFASALFSKRLQDRGKGRNPWLFIFILPGLVVNVLTQLNLGFVSATVDGSVASVPTNPITWILAFTTVVVGVWALIELGILRGTAGSNKFGEDPVA